MDDIYISKSKTASKQNFTVNLPDDGYPDGGGSGNKNKKAKRRKKHRLLKTVVSLILIILIAFSAIILAASATSGYTKGELGENSYISGSSLASSPLITNILLIGVDEKLDNSQRSDSMMLLSIDMLHAKIKLTSFLRDSWVEIPSKGTYAKLNAACSYGGPQLVVDTIEYNFRVDISHYIMVDFEMFTDIVDNLGGVDVEVTKAESDFINKTTRHTVSHGENIHLDGAQALVYCRIRKLDSDYMRTFRQRKVITALINKAKAAGAAMLLDAVQDVFPLIETDMNPFEITGLAYQGMLSLLAFDILQSRIPQDCDAKGATISGQSVVEIDLDASRSYLHDFIYTNKIIPDEESK